MNKRKEIEEKREYWVVKGNDLIQKNRFELSLTEQKVVAYICSMIKPSNILNNGVPFQLEYEFDIREYCKVCGIITDSGKNYTEIKATLKHLRDRSMWITLENGSETLVGWLSKVTINQKSGIVNIKIDEDLVPYLFNLKEKFTQYQLKKILTMKSAFSVRIYEIMRSYVYQKDVTFEINKLKSLLAVENVKSYNNFKDFRRFVLEKAQCEINEYTDINISFEPVTKGRKVVEIIFHIKNKKPLNRLIADSEIDKQLKL